MKNDTWYYDTVGKHQVDLSEDEERALTDGLVTARKALRDLVLGEPALWPLILSIYTRYEQAGKSVARMGHGFNSAIEGRNKEIQRRIERAIEAIRKYNLNILDRDHLQAEAKRLLIEANLTNDILAECLRVMPTVGLLHDAKYTKALELTEEINSIQDKLICSCLKTARDVATRYGQAVFGVDESDAIQEANAGVVAAARLYDPSYRSASNKRVRFNTYAHECAIAYVKAFVMNSSRLVRIPKNRLHRMFIVMDTVQSMDQDRDDAEKVLIRVNQDIVQKAKDISGPAVPMDMDELSECLQLLNGNSVPLDFKIGRPSDQKSKTIADMLPDYGPSSEDLADRRFAIDNIVTAIKNHLDPVEQEVISLRYFDKTFSAFRASGLRTHEEVGKLMAPVVGRTKPLSRERIRQIEAKALEKLKDSAPELEDILTYGILESDSV